MSLALYRKYRPATFAELKGQEHVAEPLQQALRNGRINHAYLFSGPRGCGKTSSARILARSLNCEQGPTPDPCGKCDSCVALGPTGTGHLDVIEIDAASHGGVDDARDLRERAFFAPVSARFKVYIIDEAHMVTREGFNALLKLVEEPPPHLKFVFATTEPEKVIGTIRSRTHHYPFRLIPPGTLQDLVEEILKAEDVPYEPNALPLAVRAGAGSARDTLSILDQLLAGSDEKGITYAKAVSLLGYTDSALLDEVIGAFSARDGAAVFAAIDRVIESGQDPRRFTADLLERIRDLVILSNVPEAGGSGLLNVPPDELDQMRRQAGLMGPGELTRAADLLHTGLTEMRGATSPRLLLELICARILLPAAYEDEASMFARLDRLERQASQGGFAQGGFAQGGFSQGGGAQGGGLSAAPAGPAAGAAPSAAAPSQSAAPAPPQAAPGSPAPSSAAQQSAASSATQQSATPPPATTSHATTSHATTSHAAPTHAAPTQATPNQTPPEQPPPAQGGDPTSMVNRPGGAGVVEPGSVDNRSAGAGAGGVGTGADGGAASGAAPAAAAAGGGYDIAAVQRLWPDIVEAVKQKSRVAWMVIMNGVRPLTLDGNLLTLSFEAEGARTNFANGGRDTVLREVLKERMGVDWRIDTVLGGAAPGGGGGRPAGRPSGPGGGSGGSGGAGGPGGHGGSQGSPGAPSAGFSSSAAPAPPRSGTGPQPSGPPSAPTGPSSSAAGPNGSASGGATAGGGTATAVRPLAPEPAPPMDDGPPPPEPPPIDESEEVDPEGDADADGTEAEASGMALIQRELGGQIIREIDNS